VTELIYAIDPGRLESGWMLWDASGRRVIRCGIDPNETLSRILIEEGQGPRRPLFVEMMACYGKAVGQEVFETAVWIGRFIEIWSILDQPWHLVYRVKIKAHHCHRASVTDANINQALRDKYGVVGTKKNPGPLWGVKKHIWSALAIATYAAEAKLSCASQIQKEQL
jgi:hypothetical protein